MRLGIYVILITSALFWAQASWADPCTTSCPGSRAAMKVNMADRCMCVGSKCFKIDIGGKGNFSTTNGTGKTALDVKGAKYRTLDGPGTKKYDEDAIRMGISANDKHSKWIHKAKDCGVKAGEKGIGGRTRTAGCVGVPCEYWPLVKAEAGKYVTICGANPLENSEGYNIVNGKRAGSIPPDRSKSPASYKATGASSGSASSDSPRGGNR